MICQLFTPFYHFTFGICTFESDHIEAVTARETRMTHNFVKDVRGSDSEI